MHSKRVVATRENGAEDQPADKSVETPTTKKNEHVIQSSVKQNKREAGGRFLLACRGSLEVTQVNLHNNCLP